MLPLLASNTFYLRNSYHHHTHTHPVSHVWVGSTSLPLSSTKTSNTRYLWIPLSGFQNLSPVHSFDDDVHGVELLVQDSPQFLHWMSSNHLFHLFLDKLLPLRYHLCHSLNVLLCNLTFHITYFLFSIPYFIQPLHFRLALYSIQTCSEALFRSKCCIIDSTFLAFIKCLLMSRTKLPVFGPSSFNLSTAPSLSFVKPLMLFSVFSVRQSSMMSVASSSTSFLSQYCTLSATRNYTSISSIEQSFMYNKKLKVVFALVVLLPAPWVLLLDFYAWILSCHCKTFFPSPWVPYSQSLYISTAHWVAVLPWPCYCTHGRIGTFPG